MPWRRGRRSKKWPGPGCAVWEITLACNLNCIHCGSAAGRKRDDELSTEEALQLCDDLKGIGCQGVALMGGEPLLRPDWVTISEKVHNLGMELSIITNGWLGLDDNVIQQIVELAPECVTVSLDGGESSVHDMIRGVEGSFDRATQAIDRFASLGLPTAVITTVHKLNLKELTKIRDYLKGKGVAWQIQMATPHGRLEQRHVLSQDEYYSVALFIAATRKLYSKELMVAGAHDMGYFSTILPDLQVKAWQGCQAGIGTLGIQSNGNITGCLALPEQFIEGNIRDRPLREIWYDKESFTFSRYVKMSDMKAHCARCELKKLCGGGCSAVSASMSRGFHQDPYCVRHIEQSMK
ncbi:MAG: radical SAM protein [Candidatus Thorarchaeota archaeon]|nr:MAG: radical SAM protein [Candidatus Thorarchaeota archaeon]